MDAVNCFVKVNAQLSFPLVTRWYFERKDLFATFLSFPEPYLFLPELLVHCVYIHLMMILAKIFLGTDKRVIPRQMLQSLRVPVLGILQMTSRFVQSIYFVTLFGNSSQSTNQHGFLWRPSNVSNFTSNNLS